MTAVPHGLSVWVTGERLAYLAAPLGTASVTYLLFASILGAPPWVSGVTAATTAVFTLSLLRWCTGTAPEHLSVGRVAWRAAGLGWLNCITAGVIAFAPSGSPELLVMLFLSFFVGAVVGTSLGAAYGVCLTPICVAASESRHVCSLNGALETVTLVSAWLGAACLALGVLATASSGQLPPVALLYLGAATVVCTATFIWANLRLRKREAWLGSVARGEVEGWSLRRGDATSIIPLWKDSRRKPTHILLRRQSPGPAPYRDLSGDQPVARVSSLVLEKAALT